jgi:DNA-dependent RNA polymerase auxiliary subunit epsilon
MLDRLPDTPYTVVRIVYRGDRENTEVLYYSTETTERWFHMGIGGSKPKELLEQQAKSIEFVAELPVPVKRTPREQA